MQRPSVGLGDYDEAQRAVARAIELIGSAPIFRFTAVEIALDGGTMVARCPSYTSRWRYGSDVQIPPGTPEGICRILWSRPGGDARRRALITQLVRAYADTSAAALAHLGQGLVHSVSLLIEHSVDRPTYGSTTGGTRLALTPSWRCRSRSW
ncbi:MAG: hypothetical protein M3376_07805 [Actinomycetota bacterium]|nr:hypothetical protein [Actinomycetota bacterium]